MDVIIDYHMGNIGSIKNMLLKIGADVYVSNRAEIIEQANRLYLPGVGSFDEAIKNLNSLNLLPILKNAVFEKRIPILGICLGMQLFCIKSEEGVLEGLGWVDATVEKLNLTNKTIKIPHMGWNEVQILNDSTIFHGFPYTPKFYFVHSYHVKCKDLTNVLATTDYGVVFHSAINKNNIFGVQFHPEKSHKHGMALLKNFIESVI